MGVCFAGYYHSVPKTIRIRNLDDKVYAALSRLAAADGITVPELMRRAANRLATDQAPVKRCESGWSALDSSHRLSQAKKPFRRSLSTAGHGLELEARRLGGEKDG
jgi:hypothetical protein